MPSFLMLNGPFPWSEETGPVILWSPCSLWTLGSRASLFYLKMERKLKDVGEKVFCNIPEDTRRELNGCSQLESCFETVLNSRSSWHSVCNFHLPQGVGLLGSRHPPSPWPRACASHALQLRHQVPRRSEGASLESEASPVSIKRNYPALPRVCILVTNKFLTKPICYCSRALVICWTIV